MAIERLLYLFCRTIENTYTINKGLTADPKQKKKKQKKKRFGTNLRGTLSYNLFGYIERFSNTIV